MMVTLRLVLIYPEWNQKWDLVWIWILPIIQTHIE